MAIGPLGNTSLSPVNTYTSLGKMSSIMPDKGAQSSFLDLIKQPLSKAIEAGKIHEETAIRSAQGKANSIEALQHMTDADLAFKELKVITDKLISGFTEITKINL